MPSLSNARELKRYAISPRVVVRRGDRLRLSGGPTYHGHRMGMRGEFELLRILSADDRIWFECRQIVDGGLGGTYCVFVSGDPYERDDLPGVLMQPHRVRRLMRRREYRQLLLFQT